MASRPQHSTADPRYPGLRIADLVFNVELGNGAYATVHEVEWNGTPCAAKRLHPILLEDESLGGTEKLLRNFEAECVTWSNLRHPGVVQFLGVLLERSSRLPVLIMEKMDTSLRKYLEDHSKEVFPLGSKAFVVHQITQALAYLHSQNPPLVHHDLSTNNVLLNVVSFLTKLTDFGMSRAISPSASRKSSIKGTIAFMPPEALQSPPQYNEKLDVFSFGNIILSTVTHEWPEPCLPTQYKGDQLIGLDEFQRREHYVEMFTEQEKQLFLPTVHRCLENRPEKRPSSVMLVQEMGRIESTLSRGSHVAAPVGQLRQQLSAKGEECRQKDEVIREKDEGLWKKDKELREVNEALWEKEEVVKKKDDMILGKDEMLQHQDMLIRKQDEELKEKDTISCAQQDTICALQKSVQIQRDIIRAQKAQIEQLRNQLAVAQKVS